MVKVTFNENGQVVYDKEAFFQYDYGQKLEIHGLSIPDGTIFHFSNNGSTALAVISTSADGVTIVGVPQQSLLRDGELNVYPYLTTEGSAKTLNVISFHVRKREKPGDYAPPDEPDIIEVLQSKLDQIIQTGIADYTPDPQDVKDIIDGYVPGNYIVNNDASTVPGKAWDAVRGKAARTDIETLKINKLDKSNLGTSTAGQVLTSLGGGQAQFQDPVGGVHDSKDDTVSFTEASEDTDITSGETHATLFGKILKSIKTLRSGLSGKFDKSNIVQTTVVSDANKVPSSVVTYGMAQNITTLNTDVHRGVSDIPRTSTTSLQNATGTISYLVRNSICYVSLFGIAPASASLSGAVLLSGMPTAGQYAHTPLENANATGTSGLVFIDYDTNTIKINSNSTVTGYCSFSYPVKAV